MIDYNNNKIIIQLLKQYEMLSNSLNLINDQEQRNNVYFQLNRLQIKIFDETNTLYEDEYKKIQNEVTTDLNQERIRLNRLIDLITSRRKYLDEKINKHRMFTGLFLDRPSFIGQNEEENLNHEIEIIDKYNNNLDLIKRYSEELNLLNDKLNLAKEKMKISESLNNEMEVKLKQLFETNFSSLNLFKLRDEKDEIEKMYKELQYILSIAEENIRISNTLSYSVDFDEQNQYEEIEEDYLKYKEKKYILELLDIYDKKTKNYDELMDKRKKISDIINLIPSSGIYIAVINELKDQYETLKREQEDIDTLNVLEKEKERKEDLILQIRNENSSEVFQDIIKELSQKEETVREEKIIEQRKKEEETRKKVLEEEASRLEEIKQRQKLIEEMRKKDMEERAKRLLEEKQKSVIIPKKEEIPVIQNEEDKMIDNPFFQDIKNEINDFEVLEDRKEDVPSYEREDVLEEFPGKPLEKNEKIANVLPSSDLTEYMKNFNTDKDDMEIFKEDQIFIDY